jgi:hypothetical protein
MGSLARQPGPLPGTHRSPETSNPVKVGAPVESCWRGHRRFRLSRAPHVLGGILATQRMKNLAAIGAV